MTEPVTMQHVIQFETTVHGDPHEHRETANAVVKKLERLAPLLIKEQLLRLEIEKVRIEIASVHDVVEPV